MEYIALFFSLILPCKILYTYIQGQKTESVHTIKMKYDELQVKLREKDIYVKHLKDQLNESEKKISQLQKVQ